MEVKELNNMVLKSPYTKTTEILQHLSHYDPK